MCSALALALLFCSACGDDGDDTPTETLPACITLPAGTCQPAYSPTFDRVFTETLQRTCAQTSACHSSEGRQGGLVFTDSAESYALLLGQNGNKARVAPGNASCSELVVRTHSVGKAWQMPPGAALDPGVLCAIRTWVQNGANP